MEQYLREVEGEYNKLKENNNKGKELTINFHERANKLKGEGN